MATKNDFGELKILFISRAYPPAVGGIENQNYELSQWLSKITPTTIIANTYGKNFLPFFLSYLFITLPFTTGKYDVVLLGDGILAAVSWWIKLFHKKTKVICITHGLDITYKNRFYQKYWVNKFLKTCNRLIAVGNQTIIEGIKRGIDKNKFIFIPNGVNPENFIDDNLDKNAFFEIIGNNYRGRKILLTSGRLSKRKGVAWFIRNVLPILQRNIIYIVVGDGADKKNILRAIDETGSNERVVMMGYVDDEVRNKILTGADLFIQPNIPVEGDMEGFGISVIEAGVSGTSVIASRIEGLTDAVIDGKNGILVEPENIYDWKEKITTALSNNFDRKTFGKNARDYVIRNFSWEKISKQYYHTLRETT